VVRSTPSFSFSVVAFEEVQVIDFDATLPNFIDALEIPPVSGQSNTKH
jgi:hypothetical protein